MQWQPTGICDCSRSPSPFRSTIVPSIGTSIEAFRLICARLQFYMSGASKPRLASSASAGNSGCSLRAMLLFDDKLKAVHRFRPCRFPGDYYVLKLGRANRLDSYCAGGVRILMLSLRRLWYMGGIIHAGTNTVMNWTFHATCRSLGLKSGVMHLTCHL